MSQWLSGMNAQGDSNYILPCGAWAYAGSNVIVRITMGAAVDYFRPADGYDLCGMRRRMCDLPAESHT